LGLLRAATRWLWLDQPALAAFACTADARHGRDRRPACAVRQRSYPGEPHSGRAPGDHRRRPSVSRHQRQRIRSNDFRIFALTECNGGLTRTKPRSLHASNDSRQCPRAAKQRDELAALDSTTSSARASTLVGISMPSAFAVLRLTTSSNLVA